MYSQIRYEFRKTLLTKEFWTAFLLSSLLVNASFVYEAFIRSNQDVFYAWYPVDSYIGNSFNWWWTVFSGMWPFLIVLPSATLFIKEKANKCLGLCVKNASYRTFLYAKVVVAGISSMLVLGIPMFINLLQCHIFFPNTHNVSFAAYQLFDYDLFLLGKTTMYEHGGGAYPFLSLYLFSPFLYACLFLMFLLLFSGICSALVASLSFSLCRKRMQLFIPIYTLVFLTLKVRDYSFARVMAEVNRYSIMEVKAFPVHTTKYFDYYLMDYFSILGTNAYMSTYIVAVAALLLGITVLCTEIANHKQWEIIQ